MDVSVIVCTYNRGEHLRKLMRSLESLIVADDVDWEILIVDNNSSDNTKSVVAEFQQQGTLPLRYAFEAQQGKTFALNTGVALASGDILAFTDDDVILDSYWLQKLVDAFRRHGCMGVGGKIVATWPGEIPKWFTTSGPYRLMAAIVAYDLGDEPCAIDKPSQAPFGPSLAVRKEAFLKYGNFRTDLDRTANNLIGGGDTEFGRRLIKGNESFMYEPGAVVYHPVEPQRTTKKFFHAWYFDYGRALVRMSDRQHSPVRYFGVPRYEYRQLARNIMKWITSVGSRRRFYYKLQSLQTWGEIVESRRSFKGGQERTRSLYEKARW